MQEPPTTNSTAETVFTLACCDCLSQLHPISGCWGLLFLAPFLKFGVSQIPSLALLPLLSSPWTVLFIPICHCWHLELTQGPCPCSSLALRHLTWLSWVSITNWGSCCFYLLHTLFLIPPHLVAPLFLWEFLWPWWEIVYYCYYSWIPRDRHITWPGSISIRQPEPRGNAKAAPPLLAYCWQPSFPHVSSPGLIIWSPGLPKQQIQESSHSSFILTSMLNGW